MQQSKFLFRQEQKKRCLTEFLTVFVEKKDKSSNERGKLPSGRVRTTTTSGVCEMHLRQSPSFLLESLTGGLSRIREPCTIFPQSPRRKKGPQNSGNPVCLACCNV